VTGHDRKCLTRCERLVLGWFALASLVCLSSALWRLCVAVAAWTLRAPERIGGAL
jgi:hypothetical protein